MGAALGSTLTLSPHGRMCLDTADFWPCHRTRTVWTAFIVTNNGNESLNSDSKERRGGGMRLPDPVHLLPFLVGVPPGVDERIVQGASSQVSVAESRLQKLEQDEARVVKRRGETYERFVAFAETVAALARQFRANSGTDCYPQVVVGASDSMSDEDAQLWQVVRVVTYAGGNRRVFHVNLSRGSCSCLGYDEYNPYCEHRAAAEEYARNVLQWAPLAVDACPYMFPQGLFAPAVQLFRAKPSSDKALGSMVRAAQAELQKPAPQAALAAQIQDMVTRLSQLHVVVQREQALPSHALRVLRQVRALDYHACSHT